MLEGLEIEKKFDGDAGLLIVDADDKGGIKVALSYEKDLDGYAKVKSTQELQTNVFNVAEKIAAKNSVTWDDAAIASLKTILGIK